MGLQPDLFFTLITKMAKMTITEYITDLVMYSHEEHMAKCLEAIFPFIPGTGTKIITESMIQSTADALRRRMQAKIEYETREGSGSQKAMIRILDTVDFELITRMYAAQNGHIVDDAPNPDDFPF